MYVSFTEVFFFWNAFEFYLLPFHKLFIDALNTFYLRLYRVGHMVHLDRERGNPLPPLHGLFFSISSKGAFMNE